MQRNYKFPKKNFIIGGFIIEEQKMTIINFLIFAILIPILQLKLITNVNPVIKF